MRRSSIIVLSLAALAVTSCRSARRTASTAGASDSITRHITANPHHRADPRFQVDTHTLRYDDAQ